MKDQSWLVAVWLKVPDGSEVIEGIQCQNTTEAYSAVDYWKSIAAEKCTCGKCPTVIRIELVHMNYEVTNIFGEPLEPTQLPDAWKGLFR